jgi:Fur family ferric uptake transcriptional regulator
MIECHMRTRSMKEEARGEDLARGEQLLTQSGGRPTPARCRVLAVLMQAEHVLTHQEVAERLGKRGAVDRVTLYRVLEWLVEARLAHRVASDDRVWRFGFAGVTLHHQHAHFNCQRCGQVFCLNEVSTVLAVNLPPRYQSQTVELTVKGLCARCH